MSGKVRSIRHVVQQVFLNREVILADSDHNALVCLLHLNGIGQEGVTNCFGLVSKFRSISRGSSVLMVVTEA